MESETSDGVKEGDSTKADDEKDVARIEMELE